MLARIYRPSKTAMQSGQGETKGWVLEFEPEEPRALEPLMGWTSSSDMRRQIRLSFDTVADAEAYARRNGIPYQVFDPPPQRLEIKAYADNFRYDRKTPWSH